MPKTEEELSEFISIINGTSDEFLAGLNPGTPQTPGKHLRISGIPSFGLAGLKKTFEEFGIDVEENKKDMKKY